jgi:hypothetical protein
MIVENFRPFEVFAWLLKRQVNFLVFLLGIFMVGRGGLGDFWGIF